MILFLFLLGLNGGLVAWEVYATTHGIKQPSVWLEETLGVLRLFSEQLGVWCARLMNPFYYLDELAPYIRPYLDAQARLLWSCRPVTIPGWFFIRGFISEYYGGMIVIFTPLIFMYWLNPGYDTSTPYTILYISFFYFSVVAVVYNLCYKEPTPEEPTPAPTKKRGRRATVAE